MAIAGRVALVPQGEFINGTHYKRLDYVLYEKNTYVCRKDCVDILPTDTEYWMLSGSGADLTGDTKNNTVTFTMADKRRNIESGETHSTIFGKIAKFLNDLALVAFTGSYNNLTDTPDLSDTAIEEAFNEVYGGDDNE